MSTFLNIDLDNQIKWNFALKHILYSVIWIMGISIFLFRLDLYLLNYLNRDLLWIINLIPFIYLGLLLVIMFNTKWYFNLALMFYPFVLILWIIPKFIFAKGKIFLFSNYLISILKFFTSFKKSITHLGLFIITLFILVLTNSTFIKWMSIVIFSYFYLRFVRNYLRKSFSPPKLFGSDIDKSLDDLLTSREKSMSFIKAIEEQKSDEKLTEDIVKIKRIERLVITNYLIDYFQNKLGGFNIIRAYTISWIYQLFGFLAITLCFYTFVNYELYSINSENFITVGQPSKFEFFYYAMKTIVFSNISTIAPSSITAKILEMLSFFTLGVFLLIIGISISYSLRQNQISKNIKKARNLCVIQNQFLVQYIENKYQTDIQTVIDVDISV